MTPTAPATATVRNAALAAVALMIAFQIVRMEQRTPGLWMAADYAIRIFGLAILFLVPPADETPFRRSALKVHWAVAAALVVALMLVQLLLFVPIGYAVDDAVGNTRIDVRPMPEGGLLGLDLTVGLALVAVHEEILFRRVARQVLSPFAGDGLVMIALSALIFGVIHWPHGVGDMTSAALFGAAAMLLYKRMGSLMPLIIAHYLVDVIELARGL